jgi:hypothetical protein
MHIYALNKFAPFITICCDPSFIFNNYNGFHYIIFIHVYEVLQSHSPPIVSLCPPIPFSRVP